MRLLLLSAFLLCPSGVVAEEVPPTTIANWTVERIFDTCAAYNRPNSEMQDAPIHALGFSRAKDGSTQLIVAFWPGALGREDTVLQVALSDLVADVPAERFDESDALRTTPLPAAVTEALNGPLSAGSLITLRAETSLAEVSFEAGELSAVMTALATCQASLD